MNARMRKGWFAVIALVLLPCSFAHAAHGIALWGQLKYKPGFSHYEYVNPDAPKGGTLKLATPAPFDSLNPFILRGLAAPGLTNLLYQSLMTQSYDEPQSYYGLIAQSVELAADRSYATFTLNPAARWHDGTAITADDVVFTFNALKQKGHPVYRIQLKPITIEKLGARQVRFHFADKTLRELPLIAAGLPVLPRAAFCPLTDQSPIPNPASPTCLPFDKTSLTPPLGSGPYRVTAVDAGRAITYARVKDYWAENLPSQKGLNNFDTIRYDVYRDDVAALEGIKSHQFDFYEEFIARNWATGYDTPAVKSGALIKTLIPHKIPRGMQGFMFNTRRPQFADARVREAIGLTLDFEWMNDRLFYGAYSRNASYFNNTEFEAKGMPEGDELKLLKEVTSYQSPVTSKNENNNGNKDSVPATDSVAPPPWVGAAVMRRWCPIRPLPQPSPYGGGSRSEQAAPSRFTQPYKVPTTDGSGQMREQLLRAQTLLNEAGWVMRDGKRVNAKTGEPLTIEFLMTQRTFERVISVMRHNLKRLGITATFRYVDASQYQQRLDARDFDMVSIWWNQGLFYPGTEQFLYWHSSQADVKGSQNLGGIKNPIVDALIAKIQNTQTLEQLRPAGRALDRVLLNEYYVIPHWNINAWRVAYWNQFGRPDITPLYNLGIDSWWQAVPDANNKKTPQANSLSQPRVASHGDAAWLAGVSEAKGTRSPSGETP